jgi:hypothetical protein
MLGLWCRTPLTEREPTSSGGLPPSNSPVPAAAHTRTSFPVTPRTGRRRRLACHPAADHRRPGSARRRQPRASTPPVHMTRPLPIPPVPRVWAGGRSRSAALIFPAPRTSDRPLDSGAIVLRLTAVPFISLSSPAFTPSSVWRAGILVTSATGGPRFLAQRRACPRRRLPSGPGTAHNVVRKVYAKASKPEDETPLGY